MLIFSFVFIFFSNCGVKVNSYLHYRLQHDHKVDVGTVCFGIEKLKKMSMSISDTMHERLLAELNRTSSPISLIGKCALLGIISEQRTVIALILFNHTISWLLCKFKEFDVTKC